MGNNGTIITVFLPYLDVLTMTFLKLHQSSYETGF